MLITLVLVDIAGRHSSPSGDVTLLDGTAGALISWTLVPTVGLVLSSGLVLSARSSWGLAQHWWLLTKMAIAAVLTVSGLALMLAHRDILPARIAAVGALMTATALSVLKPWGRRNRVRPPRHRLRES
jgi:hypothetical protein